MILVYKRVRMVNGEQAGERKLAFELSESQPTQNDLASLRIGDLLVAGIPEEIKEFSNREIIIPTEDVLEEINRRRGVARPFLDLLVGGSVPALGRLEELSRRERVDNYGQYMQAVARVFHNKSLEWVRHIIRARVGEYTERELNLAIGLISSKDEDCELSRIFNINIITQDNYEF